MRRDVWNKKRLHIWHAKTAIAIPITFLMLFVSLTLLISATYYFAIVKINAKSQTFKASIAEQSMISLEEFLDFVAWSPGAYQIYEFDDFGGTFKMMPNAKRLIMNFTADSFSDVFYNASVGKAIYELPPSETHTFGFSLQGDSRTVVNGSSSTMTQLCIVQGTEYYELSLSYRPSVGSALTESSGVKPVNRIRVYVINLNMSQSISQSGSFRLKVTCLNVVSSWHTYNFSSPIATVSINALLDGLSSGFSVPISSNDQGAIVNLETVTCSIKIQRAGS